MKKLVLAVSFFTAIFTQKVQAQDYYHGIGVQALYGIYTSDGNFEGVTIPSVMYKATLGFEISRHSSFAVSSYPSLGFNLSTAGGNSLGFQLPILAEMYLGDVDDRNFHFGLGFAYGTVARDGSGGAVMGPTLGLGGQFEFKDNLVGVRASYTYGLNKDAEIKALGLTESRSMVGVSVYYLLGQ
jgi:hypothetical protein